MVTSFRRRSAAVITTAVLALSLGAAPALAHLAYIPFEVFAGCEE